MLCPCLRLRLRLLLLYFCCACFCAGLPKPQPIGATKNHGGDVSAIAIEETVQEFQDAMASNCKEVLGGGELELACRKAISHLCVDVGHQALLALGFQHGSRDFSPSCHQVQFVVLASVRESLTL